MWRIVQASVSGQYILETAVRNRGQIIVCMPYETYDNSCKQ